MTGGRVAFVSIFCLAILVVSGAYADKPGDKGKPDKPRVPGQTKAECIVFSGFLFVIIRFLLQLVVSHAMLQFP